jgi:AcrR family transcriptional regulator
MGRPRQVTDVDILRHAREAFLEHGPHLSTQVVAERCGLSQAALFKRFGTKKDLLLRALLPANDLPFFAVIAAGPVEGPIGPQLEAIGLSIAQFFKQQVPCMATLAASGINHVEFFQSFDVPPPIRLQRAMTGWLERCGPRLKPDVDRRAMATAFLGSLHVRAFFHYIGGSGLPEERDDYVKTVVQTFLHGAEVSS